MKKSLLTSLLFTFICMATTIEAAPALPVKHRIRQPDGTIVTVYLRGDEHMHFYETTDGLMLEKDANGFYRYAEMSAQGTVTPGIFIANDREFRSTEENLYIKGIKQEALRQVKMQERSAKLQVRKEAVAPGEIRNEFPTTGEVRGLVILAEYQDIKFTPAATHEAFDKVMNEENYTGPIASGSVRDYFLDQSEGKLKLTFDVVGPVTLSHDRAYYGSAQGTGSEKVPEMVEEAVILAREKNPELDFAKYNCNDDLEVDFFYVIYAGHGEAQGGGEETVWPQSNTLEYVSWATYDGLYLGRYSCSCELSGDGGTTLDGIGTFCHEFSHILGLPDIYDPKYSGCNGMGEWDVMDTGSYNDNSKTPAGYTAMDKYTLGWLTPEILDKSQQVELEALATSNKAYFLVSEANPNEYFTLENRQNVGWDAALPGHGLLITHVEYDPRIWKVNQVNTGGYEHVALVAADGDAVENGPGDVFPGLFEVTSFTDTSDPAMKWNNGQPVGKPITDIKETDGIISFYFTNSETNIDRIEASGIQVYCKDKTIIASNPDRNKIAVYATDGRFIYEGTESEVRLSVNEGIYVVHIGNNAVKVVCQ